MGFGLQRLLIVLLGSILYLVDVSFAQTVATNSPHLVALGIVVTVFGVLGMIFVLLLIGKAIIFIVKRLKKHREDKEKREAIANANKESSNYLSLEYEYWKIKESTDNFSEVNKIGQGGFGTVYKGTLENGQEVAVKRVSLDSSSQGNETFKNEASLVAKLQHRNLVTLLGFSIHGTEKLLIYQYFKKTSLDRFIFDPMKRPEIKWDIRYKIIGGIAKGLTYLHDDSPSRIIHRDLKASNILLDEEWNPKIADFGIARLFEFDETHVDTSRVAGTLGYIAPEAIYGEVSPKIDVFSFGVLVLEIVSGQKTNSINGGLLNFAWSRWREEGSARSLIDSMLEVDNKSLQDMLKCINIALLCAQQNPIERPTMAHVMHLLNNSSISIPLPLAPPFLVSTTGESSSMGITQSTIQENDTMKSSSIDLIMFDTNTAKINNSTEYGAK